MKNILILILLAFVFHSCEAQETFVKKYDMLIRPLDVIAVSGGGYVVCGEGSSGRRVAESESWGIKRGTCFVMKVNEEGDSLWLRNLPGIKASYVLEADDGGYLVAGYSRGHREERYTGDRGQGIFVAKIGANGTPEWGKMLMNEENCTPSGMARMENGKVAILGTLERSFIIFLINQDGSEAGKITTYGYAPPPEETKEEISRYSLQRDIDNLSVGAWGDDLCAVKGGGLAMIGSRSHGMSKHSWFLRAFDQHGQITMYKEYRWKREPDGEFDWNRESDDDNWGRSIWPMQNGDFLLGGINHYHPRGLRMTRVSAKGEILWTSSFKGEMLGDYLEVLEMKNGDCVLVGVANEYSGMSIARVDGNGKTLWEKKYPKERGKVREAAICEAQDGGLVVAGLGTISAEVEAKGYSGYKVMHQAEAPFLLKLDRDGNYEE